MDTEPLVEGQIDDGQRLVEQLVRDGFEVSAAFWVKTSEEGLWHLYIASPSVGAEKLGESYRKVYASLNKTPDSWVSPSDIKLINDMIPIAQDVIEVRDRHPAKIPTKYHGKRLGSLSINEAYIYPEKVWVRLVYRVTYYRVGKTNNWRAKTESGELLRDVPAKGAVSYSTALREGESPEDANFAIVTVFLEVDPQFDEQDLEHPDVRQAMAEQARAMADEMFRSRCPEAIIEHDRELRLPSLS
jgi:hypothetical protein